MTTPPLGPARPPLLLARRPLLLLGLYGHPSSRPAMTTPLFGPARPSLFPICHDRSFSRPAMTAPSLGSSRPLLFPPAMTAPLLGSPTAPSFGSPRPPLFRPAMNRASLAPVFRTSLDSRSPRVSRLARFSRTSRWNPASVPLPGDSSRSSRPDPRPFLLPLGHMAALLPSQAFCASPVLSGSFAPLTGPCGCLSARRPLPRISRPAMPPFLSPGIPGTVLRPGAMDVSSTWISVVVSRISVTARPVLKLRDRFAPLWGTTIELLVEEDRCPAVRTRSGAGVPIGPETR